MTISFPLFKVKLNGLPGPTKICYSWLHSEVPNVMSTQCEQLNIRYVGCIRGTSASTHVRDDDVVNDFISDSAPHLILCGYNYSNYNRSMHRGVFDVPMTASRAYRSSLCSWSLLVSCHSFCSVSVQLSPLFHSQNPELCSKWRMKPIMTVVSTNRKQIYLRWLFLGLSNAYRAYGMTLPGHVMCSRFHSPDVACVLMLSHFSVRRVEQFELRKNKDLANALTDSDVKNVTTVWNEKEYISSSESIVRLFGHLIL